MQRDHTPTLQFSLTDDVRGVGTLWHYTDFTGLLGIVKNRNLRLSGVRYLNDSQEFNYGYEAVVRAIRDAFSRMREPARNQLEAVLSKFNGYIRPRYIYVASFSASRDDLSMWRAYAGSGVPIAIGFDSQRLLVLAKDNAYLKKMLYLEDQIMQDTATRVAKHFAGFEDSEYGDPPRSATHHLVGAPGSSFASENPEMCVLYKHGSFAAEQEYRLIKIESDNANLEFRQRGSLIVPFVEIELPLLSREECPITHILVGPSPHRDECVEVVNSMQRKYLPNGAQVDRTGIPFRNW